jgi:hypothetical protein
LVWGWAERFMVLPVSIIIWVPTRKPAFNKGIQQSINGQKVKM